MNEFKKPAPVIEEEEEELLQEPVLKKKPVREPVKENSAASFFKKLFVEGAVSRDAATDMLPYIMFLCVLVMFYIANSHMAMNNIRKIDKLSKEVKELSWEYKSLKADLMFKSKLTEVAKRVDTLGLKELIEPPKKIIVNVNEH